MNPQMFLLYGPKLLIISANIVNVNICANYTSQVYMDKVLINQENPPKLENFVLMFALLNLLSFLMIGISFYMSLPYIGGAQTRGDILAMLVLDFSIYMVLLLTTSSIIANVMYNKKFFMYKDDGLRAIRALKDIVFKFSIIFALLPYFLVFQTNRSSVEPNK